MTKREGKTEAADLKGLPLELRVPLDRQGRFSTELFERYQRAKKALATSPIEMYVQGA